MTYIMTEITPLNTVNPPSRTDSHTLAGGGGGVTVPSEAHRQKNISLQLMHKVSLYYAICDVVQNQLANLSVYSIVAYCLISKFIHGLIKYLV